MPLESLEAQRLPQPQPQTSEANAVPPASSNKENAAPYDSRTSPGLEPTTGSPPSSDRVPDSQPDPTTQIADSLPPPLALTFASIRSAIRSFFTKYEYAGYGKHIEKNNYKRDHI